MLRNGDLVECKEHGNWSTWRLMDCLPIIEDDPVLLLQQHGYKAEKAADGKSKYSFASKVRPIRRRPRPDTSSFRNGNTGCLFEHSADGCDENLFVMLHGIGDKPDMFMALGKTMALPQVRRDIRHARSR